MKNIIHMVGVLALLAGSAAGILAGMRVATMDKIEYQQLKFQKEPVVRRIMEGSSLDPMENRFKLDYGDQKLTVFPGVIDGEPVAAFETFGKGYSGDVGVMVGVSLSDGKIIGMGVTTHSETPGIGSKAKESPDFVDRFKGKKLVKAFRVRADGGEVDGISGATITSRGVCMAAGEAGKIYGALGDKLAAAAGDAKENNHE
ncbi:MAG: FMN-binding protein [Desulfobacter sp.]|nr:MAG: FMN-binding protein [Desulfobacter sp.]